MTDTLPMAAEKIIPHRLPMRLIDCLLEIDGNSGVVEARIVADCPLVSADGRLENAAQIELLAQAYAAVRGYIDRLKGGAVRHGFLVGIKNFASLRPLSVGDQLRIQVRTLAELDEFLVTEGEIWRGTEMVSQGEFKLWVP